MPLRGQFKPRFVKFLQFPGMYLGASDKSRDQRWYILQVRRTGMLVEPRLKETRSSRGATCL